MISGLRTHIKIGGRELLRCPLLEVTSWRHAPLSRAQVVAPDPGGELIRTWAAGDQVELRFGYRDQPAGRWRGAVTVVGAWGRDQVLVQAAGVELPLATRITQSWEHEDPAAIIRFAAGRAGLPPGRIDSPGVVFPRFVASDVTIWGLARQCEHTCRHAFGADMSRWALWLGADGLLNWGDFDEPGEVPVVATGAGLIEHLPAGAVFLYHGVTTFLLPHFRASMLFRLRDRRRGVDEQIRALVVRHSITPRSARTMIGYGDEYGRS